MYAKPSDNSTCAMYRNTKTYSALLNHATASKLYVDPRTDVLKPMIFVFLEQVYQDHIDLGYPT